MTVSRNAPATTRPRRTCMCITKLWGILKVGVKGGGRRGTEDLRLPNSILNEHLWGLPKDPLWIGTWPYLKFELSC